MKLSPYLLAAVVMCTAGLASAEPLTFRVSLDAAVSSGPVSGRLIVYLMREEAAMAMGGRATPADAPFYDDPQPIFAMQATDLRSDQPLVIDDAAAAAFPVALSQLPAGAYRAQAVLDRNAISGSWKKEPGNLYSSVVNFVIDPARHSDAVVLTLSQKVEELQPPQAPSVEYLSVPSKLLSEFHGRPVALRAAVITPIDYDPSKKYPAIYEIPGFGGDHRQALRRAGMRSLNRLSADAVELHKAAFFIGLDPDSANGHTLFVDSANNGPCARALMEELIPALEAKYPLIAQPSARIVTGHSSGGWSTVWLASQYPEFFGICFSGAPDPVDFTSFQKANIYQDPNFYTDVRGEAIASNYKDGKILMTVQQENAVEELIGPRNTSGEQWDSWQAVFGPKDLTDGKPAALFDASTGVIHKSIAEQYRAYDITELVRSHPQRYGPVFQNNIRILVGGADEWNLGEAVAKLKAELAKQGFAVGEDPEAAGSIVVVPGRDHGTILRTEQAAARDRQMLALLRNAGHVPVP